MRSDLYLVDAFTPETFHGNPAGVCLLAEPRPESWMQAIAAEVNSSETAFLLDTTGGRSIRYFTPLVEVPLCGHATLASAHILWETGMVPPADPILFNSKAGPLRCHREGEWICLSFPADMLTEVPILDRALAVLGSQPVAAYRSARGFHLFLLDGEETVRTLKPQLDTLRAMNLGGVIVTAAGESPSHDFVSRFFAPEIGINEDPVTGVAHCSLGPFWAERLKKDELVGIQLSRRGGTVRVRPRGDRVEMLGQAVTIMRGRLTV